VGSYAKERARDRIAELATRGLDVEVFFREAAEAIAPAIPFADVPCWFTLDPASLLITSSHSQEDPEVPHAWLVWEYLEDDVMKTAETARSKRGIQTLLEASGGHPSRCRVYREHLAPYGFEHMVELALRARTGEAWGSLNLIRERGEPEFDDEELDFLRALAPYLAEGTRRGLLVGESADPEGPDSPGLVVLDANWQVESLSPGVERWLAELPGHWEEEGRLPTSVVAVAARALRTAEGVDAPGQVAIARVLSREGRWVVLHGASLVADGGRRAAVILEPAHPARIIPLLMAAYGLSEREQELTRLVLRGDSTAEIADALFLSPHTVQQHLKSVFEKAGVRSRRELVGKVFFSHYEPRVRDNEQRILADKPVRGGPFPRDSLAASANRR
jgi:DNA-binding CsgD family transcriptional regulator/GAF domain-containing protein